MTSSATELTTAEAVLSFAFPKKIMTKYRTHEFLNTKTMTPRFSIHIHLDECPKDMWKRLAIDGEPLLFESESDRDSKITELRRSAWKE